MDETKRNQLAEILTRRYRQPERLVLLSHLNVDPEECTLGAQDPEEVAWRIMRWFEDRGRVEELDRAARVGWIRRRLRRLSLTSMVTVLLVFALMLGADIFGVQARICRLPSGQPALADACGAWGLGSAPTKAERVAWDSRERGSCAALRAHLAKFPNGTYAKVAQARLTARQVLVEETWTAREHPLVRYVGREARPAQDRVAAVADAQKRAQVDAEEGCKMYAEIGQNRQRSVRIERMSPNCGLVKGGVVCSMDFQARCALDEHGQRERETCEEDGDP